MLKLALWIFSIMPLRLNHAIGALLGKILYTFNTESKRVSAKNIALCFPDLSQIQQQDLVKKSLIETGKGLSESGIIWFRNFKQNQQCINKINGIEHLKVGQASILLVPHIGCWEITGRVLSLYQPITFLYKPLKNSKQEKCLISYRQQGDLSMAMANTKGVMSLQKALSNKQTIGILPDQDPGKHGSVVVPFFSQNARTMTLLAKLVRKNNSEVLMTWAKRLPKGGGFELNLKPITILSDSGKLKDDVALMNKSIEDLVKTKPEQYLWNYKRFKSVIKY